MTQKESDPKPTPAAAESQAQDATLSPGDAAAKPASGTDQGEGASLQDLEKKIVDALRTCYDPEIPVNIYELGLIYNVEVGGDGAVNVRMTLTSPMCPVAESLPPEVESKVRNVPGVSTAKVEVVWEPPWTPAMMSEAAKLQLNMM